MPFMMGSRREVVAQRTAKLESDLNIEHDPTWGMVARVFLTTRPSVNTAVHEAV